LLSEARVTDLVPADVAARLDATLASLREERLAPANVVPLRRRLGRVLVAAAVVVVVGAGGFGIAHLPSGGSADSGSIASDSAGSREDSDKSAPEAQPQSDVPGAVAARALPRLTTSHFGAGVSRLMRTTYGTLDTRGQAAVPKSTSSSDYTDNLSGLVPSAPPVTRAPSPPSDLLRDDASGCTGPDVPDAVTLPASLDGALVVLVFHPPTADSQVVEAWSCDGSSLLAAATVPH
jgi:hypothetical protein